MIDDDNGRSGVGLFSGFFLKKWGSYICFLFIFILYLSSTFTPTMPITETNRTNNTILKELIAMYVCPSVCSSQSNDIWAGLTPRPTPQISLIVSWQLRVGFAVGTYVVSIGWLLSINLTDFVQNWAFKIQIKNTFYAFKIQIHVCMIVGEKCEKSRMYRSTKYKRLILSFFTRDNYMKWKPDMSVTG